jgi:hypothetical protein
MSWDLRPRSSVIAALDVLDRVARVGIAEEAEPRRPILHVVDQRRKFGIRASRCRRRRSRPPSFRRVATRNVTCPRRSRRMPIERPPNRPSRWAVVASGVHRIASSAPLKSGRLPKSSYGAVRRRRDGTSSAPPHGSPRRRRPRRRARSRSRRTPPDRDDCVRRLRVVDRVVDSIGPSTSPPCASIRCRCPSIARPPGAAKAGRRIDRRRPDSLRQTPMSPPPSTPRPPRPLSCRSATSGCVRRRRTVRRDHRPVRALPEDPYTAAVSGRRSSTTSWSSSAADSAGSSWVRAPTAGTTTSA